jgi:transglutaminase-like putative cysteine protease
MEVHMQPRTEGNQRCLRFKLATNPPARVLNYADYLGNIVHTFDIPARHAQLIIQTEALVEVLPIPPRQPNPDNVAWEVLDRLTRTHDLWDFLQPSALTQATELLRRFAQDHGVSRGANPWDTAIALNQTIYDAFDYVPESTQVDSPIDVALVAGRGVCQDFAHIMIALLRSLGMPSRYVSGYLYYERKTDRHTPDATHAWVEILMPELGWVGFDPTNNMLASERHIRVAVGRDYSDVPPNKGVFKGAAESSLQVEVHINPVEMHIPFEEMLPVTTWTLDPLIPAEEQQAQQQQ